MIEYEIRKSVRARQLRITIKPGGVVIVTIPQALSIQKAEQFMAEKKYWIEEKVELMKRRALNSPQSSPKGTRQEYLTLKEKARVLVNERLSHFNALYGLKWNSVAIKNTSSRWGSCSKKRNLNFSYKILELTDELADYLVVHELCHLQEFNHSKQFWALVGKGIPNYLQLRKQLKGIS